MEDNSSFEALDEIFRISIPTTCSLSMLPRLFHGNRNDLLVFNTNPALLPLLGFIAKKLKKRKYVVLIHDLWPELPAQVGMISRNGFIYKLIDFVNILAFRHASGIVVLSETMKNVILKKEYVFPTAHFSGLLPLNGICDSLTTMKSVRG